MSSSGPAPAPSSREAELLRRINGHDPEALIAAAADVALDQDLALTLLRRRDLPSGTIEALASNRALMKLRSVRRAVVQHPQTPRFIAMPLLRQLFLFDLMQVAILPSIASDLKIIAEELLISRLASISEGERMSLARRASGRVASALLNDREPRIIAAALDNPRLTEALVVNALVQPGDSPSRYLPDRVFQHARWSLRPEVRYALLRNPHTPFNDALAIAETLNATTLSELMHQSRMPEDAKKSLLQLAAQRTRS